MNCQKNQKDDVAQSITNDFREIHSLTDFGRLLDLLATFYLTLGKRISFAA